MRKLQSKNTELSVGIIIPDLAEQVMLGFEVPLRVLHTTLHG